QHAPQVNDLNTAGDVQLAVGRVRRADNHNIAMLDELLLADEGRIRGELVGVQDLGTVEAQDLPQLVRERVTDVVNVGLECHSQDAKAHAAEVVLLSEAVHYESRKALVRHHR